MVTCTKCGSVDDFRTEQKANNLCAYCNTCGAFIKNIPTDKPRLFFGKWKGVAIEEINDLQYLEWALSNLAKLNVRQKEAIASRINNLKFLLR